MKNVKNYYLFAYEKGTPKFEPFVLYVIFPSIVYSAFKTLVPPRLHFTIPSFVSATVYVVLIVGGLIAFIFYSCTSKGVFLYDDYLQLERYMLPPRAYLFKFNPKIKYSAIKELGIVDYKSKEHKTWNEIRRCYFGGTGNTLVRIEDTGGSVYIFCIEEPEKFVEEINGIIKSIHCND